MSSWNCSLIYVTLPRNVYLLFMKLRKYGDFWRWQGWLQLVIWKRNIYANVCVQKKRSLVGHWSEIICNWNIISWRVAESTDRKGICLKNGVSAIEKSFQGKISSVESFWEKIHGIARLRWDLVSGHHVKLGRGLVPSLGCLLLSSQRCWAPQEDSPVFVQCSTG